MKKLIVVAHPNKDGFAHHITQAFQEQSVLKGHEVRICDLYDPKNKQEYLVLDQTNKAVLDPVALHMQEDILWADEIVFSYPMWRYDCPAILKNWFDVNFASQFAYRYKTGSLLPHQLLKGKRARIFVTGGSPKRLLLTLGLTHLITMGLARLRYCGILLKSYTVFGNMNKHRGLHARQRMLDKVKRIASR